MKTSCFYGSLLGYLTLFSISLNGAELAIIGGQDGVPTAFAGLFDLNGNEITLSPSISSLFPPNSSTQGVSINQSGLSLIGGDTMNAGFAAYISSSGSVNPIPINLPQGKIYAVSINSSGLGLIGGQNTNIADTYIAMVDQASGVLIQFPTLGLNAEVSTVALNNLGVGLAAGSGSPNPTFVALVDSGGSFTRFDSMNSPLPALGSLYSVAINDSGLGLVGGDNGGSVPFCAIVHPDKTLTSISNLPTMGQIYGVAINSSGTGVIVGVDLTMTNPGYAAFVDSSGNLTRIDSITAAIPDGILYGAAINDSGTTLIGGQQTPLPSSAFAAFVYPDMTAKVITGLPTINANIYKTAISPEGIGLIGGFNNGAPYVALVAPDTTLTLLSVPITGDLFSLALPGILAAVVPESLGLFNSIPNVLFDLSQVLGSHYMIHHKTETFDALEGSTGNDISSEIGLLADAHFKGGLDQPCCKNGNFSLWGGLFGNYVRQEAEQKIPTFTNEIAGAIAAFEYEFNGTQNAVVGGGFAYAFNYVHFGRGIGHASINQEFALVYGSINKDHFFMNLALWGGIYQSSLERHSFPNITSRSTPSGWALSPHLELAVPLYNRGNGWFMAEPFAMFDWANNWQSHFREHGSSGFNVVMSNQYASLLRSEAGVRFYEIIKCGWGRCIFEEKGSYVNKAPFGTSTSSAFFVGSISSFGIETFSSKVQNLGVAEVSCNFIPCDPKFPYGSIHFQGEFGSSFQSYILMLETGKDF
ncbi:MAG: autotransporter outer membrane beta-barrel domain-containing protein [Parachlamydiales bacterium]|nr:autotransporter outer membrane beta-barrel domain-containing protein [Parachlamydiales bacterium]